MRGKATFVALELFEFGITPAYAGKRGFLNFPTFVAWDHPRICGEKTGCKAENPSLEGSPPHMRGKAREARNIWRLRWITPAYAGKSGLNNLTHVDGEDHPRICGEKRTCHLFVQIL